MQEPELALRLCLERALHGLGQLVHAELRRSLVGSPLEAAVQGIDPAVRVLGDEALSQGQRLVADANAQHIVDEQDAGAKGADVHDHLAGLGLPVGAG